MSTGRKGGGVGGVGAGAGLVRKVRPTCKISLVRYLTIPKYCIMLLSCRASPILGLVQNEGRKLGQRARGNIRRGAGGGGG